jgi:hypothetical protein
LSPYLFCIALIPLTHELNRYKCGTERKISHLPYMDDRKLRGSSEEELRNVIRISKTINNNIKRSLSRKMCSSFKGGKFHRKKHIGNSGE